MTSSIGFYTKSKTFQSNSFEDDDILENEEDDENFSNQGYMYEVPYTSSSIDRSSIGSIPWADDAIKINKMEWEKVENLLSGLEPLSDIEDSLKKEISDWQRKFPQILSKNEHKNKNLRSDTLDVESLPSFEIRPYDEDYEIEDNATLTRKYNTAGQPKRKSSEESNSLCQLMDNFTLKSVPYKLSQREQNGACRNKRNYTSSTASSYSLCSPIPPKQEVPAVSTSNKSFRMPPILNVLDTKRKFRNLGQNKNPSFVQLTQIQQAKSAAVTQEQKSRSRFLTGHRAAWQFPFVANRFSNNRNSIVLPSIAQTPTTSSTSEVETFMKPSFNVTSASILRGLTHNLSSNRNVALGDGSTTNASTQTNTSGRSISAAVKYPRVTTYNALYLPYSASKFHAFH